MQETQHTQQATTRTAHNQDIEKNMDVNRYVTSTLKTCPMEEQTVTSEISCFHTCVIVSIVETAQERNKMFAVDVYRRQIS